MKAQPPWGCCLGPLVHLVVGQHEAWIAGSIRRITGTAAGLVQSTRGWLGFRATFHCFNCGHVSPCCRWCGCWDGDCSAMLLPFCAVTRIDRDLVCDIWIASNSVSEGSWSRRSLSSLLRPWRSLYCFCLICYSATSRQQTKSCAEFPTSLQAMIWSIRRTQCRSRQANFSYLTFSLTQQTL